MLGEYAGQGQPVDVDLEIHSARSARRDRQHPHPVSADAEMVGTPVAKVLDDPHGDDAEHGARRRAVPAEPVPQPMGQGEPFIHHFRVKGPPTLLAGVS